MAIPPQDKTPLVALTIKVREDDLKTIQAYAKYLKNSDVSYVLVAGFTQATRGDADFKKWLAEHPEAITEKWASSPGAQKRRGRPAKSETTRAETALAAAGGYK